MQLYLVNMTTNADGIYSLYTMAYSLDLQYTEKLLAEIVISLFLHNV